MPHYMLSWRGRPGTADTRRGRQLYRGGSGLDLQDESQEGHFRLKNSEYKAQRQGEHEMPGEGTSCIYTFLGHGSSQALLGTSFPHSKKHPTGMRVP